MFGIEPRWIGIQRRNRYVFLGELARDELKGLTLKHGRRPAKQLRRGLGPLLRDIAIDVMAWETLAWRKALELCNQQTFLQKLFYFLSASRDSSVPTQLSLSRNRETDAIASWTGSLDQLICPSGIQQIYVIASSDHDASNTDRRRDGTGIHWFVLAAILRWGR
jgi:hypothetical protein